MKKLRILFFASLSAAVFASCSEDSQPLNLVEDTIDLSEYEETFIQNIKYKGVVYRVLCGVKNDSLEYLDKTFNRLYVNEIALKENLATLALCSDDGNDMIEFYDTASELEDAHEMEYFSADSISEIGSRALVGPILGRAIMYDDKDYRDRSIVLDINESLMMTIPNLKDYAGFNDKTSSIRVFNFLDPNTYYKPHVVSSGTPSTLPLPGYLGSRLRTCLISYEDSNYRGKVLYCIADYSSTADISKPETATHQDRRLKNLGWNDKISSVVFRIVTMQDIEKGIYPSH